MIFATDTNHQSMEIVASIAGILAHSLWLSVSFTIAVHSSLLHFFAASAEHSQSHPLLFIWRIIIFISEAANAKRTRTCMLNLRCKDRMAGVWLRAGSTTLPTRYFFHDSLSLSLNCGAMPLLFILFDIYTADALLVSLLACSIITCYFWCCSFLLRLVPLLLLLCALNAFFAFVVRRTFSWYMFCISFHVITARAIRSHMYCRRMRRSATEAIVPSGWQTNDASNTVCSGWRRQRKCLRCLCFNSNSGRQRVPLLP